MRMNTEKSVVVDKRNRSPEFRHRPLRKKLWPAKRSTECCSSVISYQEGMPYTIEDSVFEYTPFSQASREPSTLRVCEISDCRIIKRREGVCPYCAGSCRRPCCLLPWAMFAKGGSCKVDASGSKSGIFWCLSVIRERLLWF